MPANAGSPRPCRPDVRGPAWLHSSLGRVASFLVLHKNHQHRCLLSMKKRTAIQASLALLAIIVVCWVAYGLSHPPKARAVRYQGVNTVRNASVALSSTSAPPVVQPNRQK